MNLRIHHATPGDAGPYRDLINDVASWLAQRGIDQWPGGFDTTRIADIITSTDVLLVTSEDGEILAGASTTPAGDADFWTPTELATPATYVGKLAVRRAAAGRELGDLLLRWIGDRAARRGHAYVRLDAWRDNPGLHRYYARRGWTYVRTVTRPWRSSGALFQRPAVEDPAARAALTEHP